MTRPRLLVLLLVALPLTVVALGIVLVVTGFLACGISGCSGGGFGPSFAPVQAQVGLLFAGLTLLPLTLLGLHGQRRSFQAAGAAVAVVAGALLAMVVLGLGPNGCPVGQSRAVASDEGFSPGSATCSADRDAVPAG